MEPTRGQVAAAQAWALPNFRLSLFSYLDIRTLKEALVISKGSFGEAVKVLYGAVTFQETEKMPQVIPDIITIQLDHRKTWPSDHIPLINQLLVKYPSLSFIHGPKIEKTDIERQLLRVERFGAAGITGVRILHQVEIYTPYREIAMMKSWTLSSSLRTDQHNFFLDTLNLKADIPETLLEGGSAKIAFLKSDDYSYPLGEWIEAFVKLDAGSQIEAASIRILEEKEPAKRKDMVRLFQAADGKIDKLYIRCGGEYEGRAPSWSDVLLAIASSYLRHMTAIDIKTGCVYRDDRYLLDRTVNGAGLTHNFCLPQSQLPTLPLRHWTDSPSQHHLRSLTLRINMAYYEAPALFSSVNDIAHALLAAGGSTCAYNVIIRHESDPPAREGEVMQKILDNMVKVEIARIIEKRRDGRLAGWRRRDQEATPDDDRTCLDALDGSYPVDPEVLAEFIECDEGVEDGLV